MSTEQIVEKILPACAVCHDTMPVDIFLENEGCCSEDCMGFDDFLTSLFGVDRQADELLRALRVVNPIKVDEIPNPRD